MSHPGDAEVKGYLSLRPRLHNKFLDSQGYVVIPPRKRNCSHLFWLIRPGFLFCTSGWLCSCLSLLVTGMYHHALLSGLFVCIFNPGVNSKCLLESLSSFVLGLVLPEPGTQLDLKASEPQRSRLSHSAHLPPIPKGRVLRNLS